MMKKSILLVAVTSSLGAAAYADDAPANPFTANVSVTSNYKFRGQDQGHEFGKTKGFSPAIQGGFDWTQNGWYVGNWNSSIGWTDNNPFGGSSSIEMDFYGGYRGEITKDITYDVGILRYQYPNAGFANVTEIYGQLGYGPVSLKYSHTVSRDYFGLGATTTEGTHSGRNTGYLDLSGNFPVIDLVTVNAHLGYTHLAKDLRDDVGAPSYYDWKIGATYDLSKFAGSGVSVAGAVIGANKKSFYGDTNSTRFVATLTKTF